MKILEEFVGWIDRTEGEITYLTLRAPDGEILYGEYPTEKLQKLGIIRRFKCQTIERDNGDIGINLEPLPDLELSEERRKEIDEMLKLLGDDDEPQND